ncbi:MAG TPA: class I SAM-dependent methyltransferase [Caldilineaceae bacterium]|nr:class I SAM-dependent methyltransferase [Caldilineaceae bacterium]
MVAFWGWRQRLVGGLKGTVLEIGVGEGANLPYYRHATHVYAIEPDSTRAARAKAVAAQQKIPMTVEVAPAEELPYPADAFDVVVSSLVFCSVADQQQALREIRRVLRPAGSLQMVEHICPESVWLAMLFKQLTPWWRQVANNCHLDRQTLAVLHAEGWQVQLHRRRAMFVRVTARP